MILVDGVPGAAVHAADRGLAYGDGVFRTLPLRARQPLHWQRHYSKLAADCSAIGIRCPDESVLRDELAQACSDGAHEHAAKIIVTRGGGRRGYAYADDLEPTRIVSAAPRIPYPAHYASSGVRVRRCRIALSHQPALAGVKHLNRLENVLARAEWTDEAIAEGLLCDADERVICGTMTNVFVAARGGLSTPDLSRCGVAGVTRARVIDAARSHGVSCTVTQVAWNEVVAADEVIVVNSLAGAWPVREIDGATRHVGPLARAIREWLDESDEESI